MHQARQRVVHPHAQILSGSGAVDVELQKPGIDLQHHRRFERSRRRHIAQADLANLPHLHPFHPHRRPGGKTLHRAGEVGQIRELRSVGGRDGRRFGLVQIEVRSIGHFRTGEHFGGVERYRRVEERSDRGAAHRQPAAAERDRQPAAAPEARALPDLIGETLHDEGVNQRQAVDGVVFGAENAADAHPLELHRRPDGERAKREHRRVLLSDEFARLVARPWRDADVGSAEDPAQPPTLDAGLDDPEARPLAQRVIHRGVHGNAH